MASDGYVHRLNDVEYDARSERLLGSVLHMPAGSGAFSARGGRRVHGAGLSVSVGGGPEQVTVTPGAGVVSPGSGSTGPYGFEIPTSISVTLPARPGTGLSRIDQVVAQVFDVDESAGTTREVKIVHVPGEPSGSPAAPSQPALSLLLATLTVPSAGTISVTQSTARTVAAGGILPVSTTSERNGLTGYAGLTVFNSQTGELEVHDGTGWQSKPTWQTLGFASGMSEMVGMFLPAYKLSRDGNEVKLRGGFSGTVAASGSTLLATLPTVARPTKEMNFACTTNSTSGGGAVARVRILTTGEVEALGSGTARTWVSIDGVTFDRA